MLVLRRFCGTGKTTMHNEPLLPCAPTLPPTRRPSMLLDAWSTITTWIKSSGPQDGADSSLDDVVAGERMYLVLVFLIGTLYMYGPLMTYPLYKELVHARGETEVSSALVAAFLFAGRMFAQTFHFGLYSWVMRPREAGLPSLQALVTAMFAICAIGLFAAADSRTGPLGVLTGVCSLNLVSSRVFAGALFTVPREDMIKTRTFVYDVGSVAGCLWSTLAMAMLRCELGKVSGMFRFCALVIPLIFCLVAWFLLSPHKFYNAAQMEENQRLCRAVSIQEHGEKGASKCPAIEGTGGCAEDPENVDSDDASVSTATPELLESIPSSDSISACVKESSASTAGLFRCWEDARFRVIATTWCLCWWSFNFYGYTAFPVLIAKTGPPLEVVSSMYTLEGLLYTVVMMFVLPRLRSKYFHLFFGYTWLLTLVPPLAVCFLGRIHWVGYLIALWAMDIFCAIVNATVGVVLLRCVPWELITSFYTQVGTLGGLICGISNIQLAMHDEMGWPLTALIGHGVPLCIAGLVYLCHYKALKEIFAKTVR